MRTNRSIVLGFLILAFVVVAGSVALAQGVFTSVFSPRSGDTDVVATVDGAPIPRGAVRTTVELALLRDSSADRQDVTRQSLTSLIQARVAIAEAHRQGIDGTAQALVDLEAAKAACRSPETGQLCRDVISAQGQTWDEFWDDQLKKYRDAAATTELTKKVASERDVDIGAYDKFRAFEQSYLAELIAQADVRWYDRDLRRLYQGR